MSEHRIRSFCLILLLALAGCGPSPPSIESVKSRFAAERSAAEELRTLVAQDQKGAAMYAVGLDHIGDYWAYEGEWSSQKADQKKLNLQQVLQAERIGEERYGRYQALFKRLQAERVTHVADKAPGPVTRILIYRAGLAVSGCSMELLASPAAPSAHGKRGAGGGFVEVTDLGGGWYVVYDCS